MELQGRIPIRVAASSIKSCRGDISPACKHSSLWAMCGGSLGQGAGSPETGSRCFQVCSSAEAAEARHKPLGI